MSARGPDGSGTYLYENLCLAHNRLAVIDPENGKQPMEINCFGREYVIAYNGEIYNAPELRRRLEKLGAIFKTNCDTEVVLWTYAMYKEFAPGLLNGIFAFAVFDKTNNSLFVCRDRLGVKPLYYAVTGESVLFASEIKALLAHPGVSRKVDLEGIWQLFFLAPATVPGSGVFRDIKELKGGEYAIIDRNGMRISRYWELEAKPFTGTRDEAVDTVASLLEDALRRQLVSDVPLCTFLSGGLDSSVLTALAVREYGGSGKRLSTYSFEYENNSLEKRDTLFQPTCDDDYAKRLAKELGTDHTVLTISPGDLALYLYKAVDARDFPGQADIDSSLLYYCEQVKKKHTVAISGECSDEIFGGYPWFYQPRMLF